MSAIDALLDWTRLRQFIAVGFVGTGVDLSISIPLVVTTEITPELAKFLGAEAAIIVMFIINDRWTFGEVDVSGYSHQVRRLVKSNIVRAGGVAIQLTAVFLLTRMDLVVSVAGTDIWPILTMPIAIACGFLANYLGESVITWRVVR